MKNTYELYKELYDKTYDFVMEFKNMKVLFKYLKTHCGHFVLAIKEDDSLQLIHIVENH